jgi:hypothetical protein
MENQTTTKLVGLIKDLKMYVHGIPYITTYIVPKNIVIDLNCSMMFGKPCFTYVKITHDWANNMITR